MSDATSPVRGGIEAGGTKFVCAIGTGPDDVRAHAIIPTTSPGETLDRVAAFFTDAPAGARIETLGIASFGPLDLAPDSPTYGHITTTPKPGWEGTDLVGAMRKQLDVPVTLETDVNGAAYGEFRWGAGQGLHSSAYLTVGTGIGGGAVIGGEPLRGMLHPEMGHLHMQRHPDDEFAGSCPFHGDCLEGLASGPAIKARFGAPPEDLGRWHDAAVEFESWYLAQLVTTVVYLLTPQRIVLGGGVMEIDGLFEGVRASCWERLAGAIDGASVAVGSDFLVRPALGNMSGVLGAMALAELPSDDPALTARVAAATS